ncbi:hypothetical protein [Kitasatospora griseola]
MDEREVGAALQQHPYDSLGFGLGDVELHSYRMSSRIASYADRAAALC